jgi:DNA-binding transcriptional ArsR family regulator
MTYETVLSALGDPTRRQLFERLRGGPSSVGALAEGMPISRPAVSQHLKILKEAGLVSDEAQGARRVYCENRDGLAALRSWVEDFWGDAHEVYQAEIQRQLDERKWT